MAAAAWLLKEFGLPGAGVTAAFLLAIHPWHIRYASEARGYSLLVFLVPVLFVFWRRAMITGRWKWWGAFAATEFSLIYCYPGAIFVLVVLNIITLVLIATGRDCAKPRITQAGRWFCVNVLAAILTFQLMLPLYPQAKKYFDFVSSQGFISGWSWVRNTICFMIGGAPWTKSDEPWAGYPEWLARYVENPILFVVAASFAIALILLGAVYLLRRGWASATFVFVMSVCPPITFVFAYFKRFLLYENYVIYSLPGVVVCAATGLSVIASWHGGFRAARIIVSATASLLVLGYFLYTNPFRHWIVEHPLQQIRESVIYCRGTLDPSSSAQKSVRTASFCIPPYLYDAHMERLDSAGAFIDALRRADHERVPLLLNVGMPWAARQYSPQMWSLFTNRELFEEPVRLRGFEPSLDRLVAKYKPHSAENFDFSQYKTRGTLTNAVLIAIGRCAVRRASPRECKSSGLRSSTAARPPESARFYEETLPSASRSSQSLEAPHPVGLAGPACRQLRKLDLRTFLPKLRLPVASPQGSRTWRKRFRRKLGAAAERCADFFGST